MRPCYLLMTFMIHFRKTKVCTQARELEIGFSSSVNPNRLLVASWLRRSAGKSGTIHQRCLPCMQKPRGLQLSLLAHQNRLLGKHFKGRLEIHIILFFFSSSGASFFYFSYNAQNNSLKMEILGKHSFDHFGVLKWRQYPCH